MTSLGVWRDGFLYPVTNKEIEPNPWVIIHSRYADAIESNQWDAPTERNWLDTEFAKLVPCGSCGNKWLSLSATIDLSTAETAFKTLWQAHNTVSTEHAETAKQAISFEKCQALYMQQPSMDDCCYAVTSLSPDRVERQTLCLNTWKRAGLTIFAVQSASEVELLKPIYPQISTWCIHSLNGHPTINRIADIAATVQKPIMIINADIEIHGEQRLIREAVAHGNMIGIRHNYDSQWWVNEREHWGVDVFSINPEDSGRLPRLPLQIGQPVWDYWLLHHFRHQPCSWISEPLFFHRSHKINWSKNDWDRNAKLFTDHYCLDEFDSIKFRRQFPFAG